MLKIKIITCLFLSILTNVSFAKTVEFNLFLVDLNLLETDISINSLYILEDYNLSVGPFYKTVNRTLVISSGSYDLTKSKIGIRFESARYELAKSAPYFAVQLYQDSLKDSKCQATNRFRTDFLSGYGYRFSNSISLKAGVGMSIGSSFDQQYNCESYEYLDDKLFFSKVIDKEYSLEFDLTIGYSF